MTFLDVPSTPLGLTTYILERYKQISPLLYISQHRKNIYPYNEDYLI